MNHTICVLCLNHIAFTKACIDSILSCTDLEKNNARLVVIDNGSTDSTPQVLKQYKNIEVIRNRKNVGVFKAMNQGMRLYPGNTFTIVANDHIVRKGWFEALVDAQEKEKGIWSPLVPDLLGTPLITQIAKKRNQLREKYFYRTKGTAKTIQRFMDELYGDFEDTAQKIETEAKEYKLTCIAWGGLQMIHADVIKTIGYFDEAFGHHFGADMDYMYRAKVAGFRAWNMYHYVHHFGSITLRKAIADIDDQEYCEQIKKGGTQDYLDYKKTLVYEERVNKFILDNKEYSWSL